MPEFQHSIVLFTGDDGLPLEFNVRNTKNKLYLKELIEHGGGICTQSDNAVHLISPGTKVLNAVSGKKLVSSSYIYDCVKQNYLLDVNDYVFVISEAQMSDISDEDSERLLEQRHSTGKFPAKSPTKTLKLDISPIKTVSNIETDDTTPSNLTVPSSNSALPQASNSHSESFVEGSQDVTSNVKITSHVYFKESLGKPQECMVSPSKEESNRTPCGIKSPDLAQVSNVFELKVRSPKKLVDDVDKASLIPDVDFKLISVVQHSDACEESISKPTNHSQPLEHLDCASPVQTEKVPNDCVSPKRMLSSPVCETSPKRMSLDVYEENIATSPNILEGKENDMQPLAASPLRLSKENDMQPHAASPLHLSKENPALETNERVEITDEVNVIQTVVSSSQPEDLDQFDNMLLRKSQRIPSEDEDNLSQSYTVSSSADAQVNSKPCSEEKELQNDYEALPDSPSLNASPVNVSDYLKNLEAEVKEILLKPSPKSIQDKIALVKYVCCARKLPPATVLELLLSKSFNL